MTTFLGRPGRSLLPPSLRQIRRLSVCPRPSFSYAAAPPPPHVPSQFVLMCICISANGVAATEREDDDADVAAATDTARFAFMSCAHARARREEEEEGEKFLSLSLSQAGCCMAFYKYLAPLHGQNESSKLTWCLKPKSGIEINRQLGITTYKAMRHDL